MNKWTYEMNKWKNEYIEWINWMFLSVLNCIRAEKSRINAWTRCISLHNHHFKLNFGKFRIFYFAKISYILLLFSLPFASFSLPFAKFVFAKKCEILQISLRNMKENFRGSFCSLKKIIVPHPRCKKGVLHYPILQSQAHFRKF